MGKILENHIVTDKYFWWRCRELNPGPKSRTWTVLQAYFALEFLADAIKNERKAATAKA